MPVPGNSAFMITNISSPPETLIIRGERFPRVQVGVGPGQTLDLTDFMSQEEAAFNPDVAAFVSVGKMTTTSGPLEKFSNAARLSATLYKIGTAIWNTDDNAPNYSDGTNWRDAAGTIT